MSASVCCWEGACGCCWAVAGGCCRRRGPRKRSIILACGLGISWGAVGCVGIIDVETPPPEEACIV